MREQTLRWLVDVGLPQPMAGELDAIHAWDIARRPGPVGLREAAATGRVLVTRNQGFRGTWELSLPHPGIVILEDRAISAEELSRNLAHLRFRLEHDGGHAQLANQRFLIKVDRAILHLHTDGAEHALEPWKLPRPVKEQSRTAPQLAEALPLSGLA